MNIIYSFNKNGYEAQYWQREIASASDEHFKFIPFNHDPYLDCKLYLRAQLLDNLYYTRHPDLMRMYSDLQDAVKEYDADVIIVDNCPPYHPDWLRKLPVYKVLRTSDGPICAYDRDFAYVHAYDHVLYHSPAYSRDMGMGEKLRYIGAKRADFWPLGLFDSAFDASISEQALFGEQRDIDVIFIGAQYLNKMPLLAKIKKVLGRRFRLHGLTSFKKNVYFNLKYGFPGWIRPVRFEEYVSLYQRTKIGINIHNRGDYTVGSFRLFELAANGVMQISDGGEYLNEYFRVPQEVVGYRDADDLIDKLHYYLEHEDERMAVCLNGYRRVMRDYRIVKLMRRAGELIKEGMARKPDVRRCGFPVRSEVESSMQ